jgi:hypothetical protein
MAVILSYFRQGLYSLKIKGVATNARHLYPLFFSSERIEGLVYRMFHYHKSD